VLEHHRRRVVHFNVTDHPTAGWTAQQIRGAFPWEKAPRFLIRDRDGCYGDIFRETVHGMNIRDVLTAPHSPWQNGYAERLIGSIRRECLDHIIVLIEAKTFRCHDRRNLLSAAEAGIPPMIRETRGAWIGIGSIQGIRRPQSKHL